MQLNETEGNVIAGRSSVFIALVYFLKWGENLPSSKLYQTLGLLNTEFRSCIPLVNETHYLPLGGHLIISSLSPTIHRYTGTCR